MPGGDVSSPPGDHPTHLGTRYLITQALYIKDTSIITDNTEYSTHSTPINDGIFVLKNILIATSYVIITTVALQRKLLMVKCIAHLYHDFSLPIVNQKGILYTGKFSQSFNFTNFAVFTKFIHTNRMIYIMVHTLFLTDLQKFDSTKISRYTVYMHTGNMFISHEL